MTQKVIKTKFDLYDIYDRMFEGCEVFMDITYDIEGMLEKDELNLQVINVCLAPDTLDYAKAYPFDIPRIEKEISAYYLPTSTDVLEKFSETISDEEYDQIEYLL